MVSQIVIPWSHILLLMEISPVEISDLILFIRGKKVLLDFHLASLYEVETRTLKQQVRRNLNRFPDDFMFELNKKEIENIVSQNVIPNKQYLGGAKPMAFTEQGVAMLSSVLRNDKAVQVNIAIMRTFVQLRVLLESNTLLQQKILNLEKKYDKQFAIVFQAIKKLIRTENTPRRLIGFQKTNK